MSKEELLLIEGCKKDVRLAQQSLYLNYKPVLERICLRYVRDRDEAHDVLHDVFIKIFQCVRQYKGEGSFEGWLKRITINHCLALLKKNKNIYIISDIEEVDVAVLDEEELLYSEKTLNAALMKLPIDFRVVFSLFVIEEMTHKEIAKQLDIPEKTSRTRFFRAKTVIRKNLKELS